MKVLHVIPSLSAVHGGPTRAMAAMERALSAEGIEVETACTDDDGPGRRNGKPVGVPLNENDVVRRYFPKSLDFYKASIGFTRWIFANARHYDLVHIHALFSFTTPIAAWAARRANVPYVVRPLGTLDAYGVTQRRPWLKRASIRWVEGPVLRAAAAVHFTSPDEEAKASRWGLRMRGVVIPLGVDVPHPVRQRAYDPAAPRLLYLSRLDPKKNLEGLLDAVALLRHDLPGLRLVVAGDGAPAYVASLRQRADTLDLATVVHWAGHLEGDAKAAALADSDVFVLPSFSENFGIAAAEALAEGLPCVLGEGVALATDVRAADAGVVVATDAASICAGLRRIVGDPAAVGRMGRHARRLATERFSTAAMGVALRQLYTDILRTR